MKHRNESYPSKFLEISATTSQSHTSFDEASAATSLSNTTNEPHNIDDKFWIFTAVTPPISAVALYICITQILFCIAKSNLWQRKRNPNNLKRLQRSINDGDIETSYANVLNAMSAFGTACAFLRPAVDFRLILSNHDDLGCDLSMKFKLACHISALLCIYLILWLRQRIFYHHPRLKHLTSKFVRFVSFTMSIVIICGLLLTLALFLGAGKYQGSNKGCVVSQGPLLRTRWIVLISCTITFHVCLLSLFIYPLIKHTSAMSRNTTGDRRDVIMSLVKRAAATSSLCVLSDVLSTSLAIVTRERIISTSSFIYDVNIVVNGFCMVMSFPDWKQRLCSWRLFKKRQEQIIKESDIKSSRTSSSRG